MDKIKDEHLSSHNNTPIKEQIQREDSHFEQSNSQEQQQNHQQYKQRRSRSDNIQRQFSCGCGKSYLSGAALYTHVKQKHGGVSQKQSSQPLSQPNQINKQKKQDFVKHEDEEKNENDIDAQTVYDDIINFFAKHSEKNKFQKIENNEGYDWILEIFPRHYFRNGTDYYKIIQHLEKLIKQINSNQVNNQSMNHQNIKQNITSQEDKKISQQNEINKRVEDNFTEENTFVNEVENVGSPNNFKNIKKKLSDSTAVQDVIYQNTKDSLYYNNNDAYDNHKKMNLDKSQNKQDQQDSDKQKLQELEQRFIDIYDAQRDLRLTSLNRIFSIFILNISSKISQSALIEVIVFIILFRKALNQKGWEKCSSSILFDELKHQYGQLFHSSQSYDNTSNINQQQINTDEQKRNNKKFSCSMTTTTESPSSLANGKVSNTDQESKNQQSILSQEDQTYEQNKIHQNENQYEYLQAEQHMNNSDPKKGEKNMVKIENNSELKLKQLQFEQFEFCEQNCGQFVSEMSNTFIIEFLPLYLKTVLLNANELHVISSSDEGIKNSCYIMQLFINWMYVFKFSESKLEFSYTDEDFVSKEQQTEELQDKKKQNNEKAQKIKIKYEQQNHVEQNVQNKLNKYEDTSYENHDRNDFQKFKNRMRSKKNNYNSQYRQMYDDLEDNSKENKHIGNQYDHEMLDARKHGKIEEDNCSISNDEICNLKKKKNKFKGNQMQDQQFNMMRNMQPMQIYHGTPSYMHAPNTINSTTYFNGNSNYFFEPQYTTAYYNSGNNSTTFYHPPPTPVAYYNNSGYSNTYHNMEMYPKSTKFSDSETSKTNEYSNNYSVQPGPVPVMYTSGYVAMPQYGYTTMNPVIYPAMQQVYYPQQQVFLSPQQVMSQKSIGDNFNQIQQQHSIE